MPLTKLLPLVKELSYSDKLLLLHYLTDELLKESGLVPLNTQNTFTSQGLHDSFEAAAVLAKALVEKKVALSF
ncbi:hypothetical protein VB711_21570 [Cronbergia sp. UHCC 0137]|uniref:hypothetical protein n=1 Tax=Cronbergia sp. UHCC 0137 TaxID=3110239 RepID=UPI002B1F4D8C|nr:hypothetical protein [Cronbergia sp. UHCC 0137]MEA5620411.1 hypothetical protein [Cronbergia sp. UHCC 0137]